VATGALAEDDQFRKGVAAESVPSVDGDTGALAGGVEAVDAALSVLVDLDAAHRIVLAGLDRHRLDEAVDSLEVLREVQNVLEAVHDPFLAEVTHIEVDVLVVDAAALVNLGQFGAGDNVPRGELRRSCSRSRART